jgi:hypothetical protein
VSASGPERSRPAGKSIFHRSGTQSTAALSPGCLQAESRVVTLSLYIYICVCVCEYIYSESVSLSEKKVLAESALVQVIHPISKEAPPASILGRVWCDVPSRKYRAGLSALLNYLHI